MRSRLEPEQRPDRRDVQPGPGPVQHPVKQLLHLRAGFKQQVPAVLGLVDRVGVAEPAGLLLGQVQAEAQAGRIDPPVADLAQAPYSRVPRPGICDPGQALRIRDLSKTVPLLGETDALALRGDRDILVAIEDHLRAERRVSGHLDRQVPEGRVHDVKAVVVDVLPLLLQAGDDPARGTAHLPHRRRGLGRQDQEHPRGNHVSLQVLLGDQVLTLPGLAEDDRDPVRGRPGLDPAGEPPGHPHQVRVIQLVVAAMQPPPPAPEPARVMAQREIHVQHHPVHAIVRTRQQARIPLSKVIGHPPTVGPRDTSRQPDCPGGAAPSGRSPGRSVAVLGYWDFDIDLEFSGRLYGDEGQIVAGQAAAGSRAAARRRVTSLSMTRRAARSGGGAWGWSPAMSGRRRRSCTLV